jgi:predicted dehydrogenase
VTDRARASERLRVGVLGTGFAAECHADALRRLPGIELAGIASRTPSRAREAAERLGAGRGYETPAQLIEDPSIDAVHVCTINRLHAELSSAALQAGKHVVAEKPLATSSAESEALAALAEDAAAGGTLAAVCFNYRHYPLVQQIRGMLAGGEYGAAHFMHGSYLQDWLLYETDWNWRLEPHDNGASRAIADIGSHWIDLVQHVTGDLAAAVFADLVTHHQVRQRPASVTSTFATANDGEHDPVRVESEDFGTVLLRFESGARGTFAVSQASAGRKNRLLFEIDTSEASFAWDQEHPDTAWVGRRHGPNLEFLRDPGLTQHIPQLPPGHPEGWRDALRNLFADFYGAVAAQAEGHEHEPAFATFADGHRTTLLVEAIMRSDQSESWTSVGEREGART